MGIIRSGPPEEFVLRLKDCFRIQAFVETGTYYGDTAMWAAVHFPQVVTIEYSRSIYEKTIARYGLTPNVNFVFGDSRTILQTILPTLSGPAVIWLDGHWSGSETYGDGDECPLLEEIRAVVTSQQAHFILIDDARLFASPPPRPHRPEQWPSIAQVIDSLKSGNYAPYIVIAEDVIVAVPEHARELLVRYCQEVNTRTWEQRPQTFPISRSPTASSEPDRSLPTIQTHRKRTPIAGGELLDRLHHHGLWQTGQPLRLHLGCGEKYLDGYVNVDYPQSEHNVMLVRADLFADLMELDFPTESVDEIRLHHVFEHFNRVTALALLIKWHKWLKIGGKLHIETPDLLGSAQTLLSNASWKVKAGVVRHLVGDQAASWAYHIDQWFPERFERTLKALGYAHIETAQQRWPHEPYLANVHVRAMKEEVIDENHLLESAEKILWESTVADSEEDTYRMWCRQLRRSYFHHESESFSGVNGGLEDSNGFCELSVDIKDVPLDEIHDFNQRTRNRWIAVQAGRIPRGSFVLDVGAGTCPYRQLFAHCRYKTHDFKKYEGEKLGGGTAYGAIDYVSDILTLPLEDMSVDVVLCTEVLEHVPEPVKALRELIRVVKPGGKLILTAPLGSGLHQLPFHYYGGFSPEWYRHFAEQFSCEVNEITPNGGFFKLMAQELARVANLYAQYPELHGRNTKDIYRLFSERLPRFLYELERRRVIDQFTVGYHVVLTKKNTDFAQLQAQLKEDPANIDLLLKLASQATPEESSRYFLSAYCLNPNHPELQGLDFQS